MSSLKPMNESEPSKTQPAKASPSQVEGADGRGHEAHGSLGGILDVPDCHVLVVDDDPGALEEYAETIGNLGYACHVASGAAEALRSIAGDSRIGIVMTDVQMPGMDGLSFLGQLSARFGFIRPIVPIVVTGYGTLEQAVQAMRYQAVDMLAKPVSPSDLAGALRGAAMRWAQQVGQLRLAAATASRPANRAVEEPAAGGGTRVHRHGAHSDDNIQSALRTAIRNRRARKELFQFDHFADPAWDILLDLASARLARKTVPVLSACAAAGVPTSTALRWIRLLVEEGLVRRWSDPSDRRRDLVEIQDHAMAAMREFMERQWDGMEMAREAGETE